MTRGTGNSTYRSLRVFFIAGFLQSPFAKLKRGCHGKHPLFDFVSLECASYISLILIALVGQTPRQLSQKTHSAV